MSNVYIPSKDKKQDYLENGEVYKIGLDNMVTVRLNVGVNVEKTDVAEVEKIFNKGWAKICREVKKSVALRKKRMR